MKRAIATAALGLAALPAQAQSLSYAIVDTGQNACYSDTAPMPCPAPGQPFFGQDGQVAGNQPRYRDNGDGTISDLVTGLMWQKGIGRTSFADAPADAAGARTGGYADWRVPTTKELYSLIQFSGTTGMARPETTGAPSDARPYLDNRVFVFEYPSTGRYIDAQFVTSTAYGGRVMNGQKAFFGVNFADGRIKGYPQDGGRGGRTWYARYVRGNPDYGRNHFADNGDGTVTDRATGLTWTKDDSGRGLDWGQALAWCDGLSMGGHSDWRLPNAKELHSIVDYGRAPDTTDSAAIDPVFNISAITDPEGKRDWPFFWSSTTHLDGPRPGSWAVYVAFGRAQGYMGMGGGGMGGPGMAGASGMGGGGFGPPPGMRGMGPGYGPPPGMGGPGMGGGSMGFGPPPAMGGGGMGGGSDGVLLDVHGAGAQRSSPKSGDESRLPKGLGPQGDIQRIYNHARCVRG